MKDGEKFKPPRIFTSSARAEPYSTVNPMRTSKMQNGRGFIRLSWKVAGEAGEVKQRSKEGSLISGNKAV